MKTCKVVCAQLKAVRKAIAQANGIEYEPAVCTFDGDCLGTCPKCEEELVWIADQLRIKEEKGEKIILDGVAVGLIDKIQPTETDLLNTREHISKKNRAVLEKNERIEIHIPDDTRSPFPVISVHFNRLQS